MRGRERGGEWEEGRGEKRRGGERREKERIEGKGRTSPLQILDPPLPKTFATATQPTLSINKS